MKALTLIFSLLLTASAFADLSSEIPDLCQRNAAFSRNGGQYCAPVSVSNTMMWLSKNGYPKLASGTQIDTVKTLAKAMGTDRNGTGGQKLARGLREHLARAGYQGAVTYLGWRSSKNRRRGKVKVSSDFLDSGLGPARGAWLNIGWYKKTNDGFKRFGGHWVTLVDSQPGLNRLTLKIHDPSPRTGKRKTTQTVVLEKMNSGSLSGKYKGMPMSARGFYKVSSGLKMSKKYDTAILDGAVVLALK